MDILTNLKGHSIGVPLTPKNWDYGTAIAGGASLIGTLISGSSAGNLNKKNRKWQSEENQKNRDFQEYMTENYQTLQAQRAQAEEAGLNPNLLFGEGSAGGVAPAPSSSSAPNASVMPDLSLRGFSEAMSSLEVNDSVSKKNKAEANKTELETPSAVKKLTGEAETADQIGKMAAQNVQIEYELKQSELLLNGATTAAQNAMADNFLWQSKMMKYDLEELKPLEKQQIQAGISKDLAQAALMHQQGKLTEQQCKLAIAQTYKTYMDAVSNRISANAQAESADAAMMNADTNRQLMPSQIRMNDAISSNQTSQSVESQSRAVGQNIQNETNQGVQRYVIKSMETQCEILGKQNAWFNAQQVGSMIRDVGVGIGSAVGGISSGASKFASGAIPIKGFGN